MRHLSRALVNLGHHVDVLSADPLPELDERVGLVHLPGLNLYERGLWGIAPSEVCDYVGLAEWLSKFTGGFPEPWAFCERAVRWLEKHRDQYDIVHDNQSLGKALLRIPKLGLPVLATIHHPPTRDLYYELQKETRFMRRFLLRRWYYFTRMQKYVARSLQNIVTVSHASRQDIGREYGIDCARISVVHNGVDTHAYQPTPLRERKANVLMAVSSSEHPLKGLKYLFGAFATLLKKLPDLELLLVGKLKKNGHNERFIRTLGIAHKVRNLTRLKEPELARCYSEAGVVVVSSLYEGFGFPAAEAMSCGAPVVCTNGGALPEIVADSALVVEAGDSLALAEGIENLLKDRKRAENLGTRARARILENFTWDRAATQMVALYEGAIDQHQ